MTEEVREEKKRSELITRIFAVAIVFAVIIFGAYGLYELYSPDVIITPLPSNERQLKVGPIELAEGSSLEVLTPDFHVELNKNGNGTIISSSSSNSEGVTPLEKNISVSREVLDKILLDLAELKAEWSARRVGEDAQETEKTDAAPNQIDLSAVEKKSDGTEKIILRLSKDEPEFNSALDALAPIRLEKK
ncbi:TPA: hypothetical protein DEF17_02440 [bacterium]|nr:MAG: hypothetical protein AUJ18_09685 [Candidatus Hydrogenedentes bacterium CG1_02_42_14]PIU48248.1 MAG: hypothetical protein COS94_03165 [Candidatus Hydrogenedentes bacterium CG07_land_8_20_14_0_80_42_17]HBW46776.1 hypothetical protein [bacterium]